MRDHSSQDIAQDPYLAIESIAKHLRNGALKLFLGAGASRGFGLPCWRDLMIGIIEEHNLKHSQNKIDLVTYSEEAKSTSWLQSQMDIVEESPYYLQFVKNSLYGEIEGERADAEYWERLFLNKAPLLLAIAALCLGNTRGRVRQVFTLNYDDVLEQYLTLLGMNVFSSYEHFQERKFCDLEIFHVNGFLPADVKSGKSSKEIILSRSSFIGAGAKIKEDLSGWLIQQMIGYKGLFVGLSGEDDLFNTIHTAFCNLRKSYNPNPASYDGFWLMTPSAYEKNHKIVSKMNICPVPIEKEDIPAFILSCCKEASEFA